MSAPGMADPIGARRRAPWPLILMILVFAAPVVATWFYLFFPQYLPDSRSNRGELLSPPVPLPGTMALVDREGTPLDPGSLEGDWTLVYISDGACGEACIERLTHLRQIRLALGEGRGLVGRLLLVADADLPGDPAVMDGAFAGMKAAGTDRGGRAALLAALGADEIALGGVYILDPRGALMMRYAVDAAPEDILKDMERLLKGSKNWIKGANYGHD
jgi:cytochrome oxidase Cu insertion factor (SCO1/SenC/PrrC family)